jgi:hypothetical protein
LNELEGESVAEDFGDDLDRLRETRMNKSLPEFRFEARNRGRLRFLTPDCEKLLGQML